MFQHSLASSTLRRTRTAVTAAALALAAIGPVVGIASPALAAGPTTFSNGTALTVADGQLPCSSGCTPGLASTYPSPITVSGMAGTLSNLTVTLTGVTHAYTSDFDVLLTGPGGQKFILASDAGNNGGSSNATVTFSDAAAGAPSADTGWGNGVQNYKPFNYSGDPDVWPSPAPAGPYSNADNGTAGSLALNTTSFASVFNGTSPNGVWNLYVVDDAFGDQGSISGGWSMSLTTASAAATLTTVSTSASPVSTGASLTLSAHVTQASDSSNVTAGTVTFSDGSTVLGAPVTVNGSGVASMTTSSLAEGTHTITAAYTGSVSFGNSSGSVSQVVDHPTTQVGNSYCNTGPLTLNDGSVGSAVGATPYPSHIVISGASGGLSALTVTLKGVNAAFADDLDAELVGPLGQKLMLASDAGGGTAISGANVTFDDNAGAAFAAGAGGWGFGASSSKPVDYNTGTDVMPAPAPSGWASAAPTGAATLTTTFGGSSANGTWSLYVADDSIDGSPGSMTGGWCLNTTSSTDPATTTVLTSSVNPTALGGSTTFSAHVTASSGGANVTVGTVTFRDGGTVIGSAQALSGTGTASVSTSALTEGSHTITATYSGVGGSFNLSSATLTQTVNGVTTVSGSTFCNAGGITVNDPPGSGQSGTASPYGSHIVISGVTGNLSNLTVAVKAISHAAPDDLDILLVGPGGQSLKLASDAGGLVPISNLNVTFDDAAAGSLPDSSSWGSGVISAKPTDYNDGTDSFPAPAPAGPYGSPAPAGTATLNGTFDGSSPNGTWNLYVVDDSLGQTGTIGSWCLTLSVPPSAAADTYTAGMNTPLTVPAPGVLGNDSGFPAPFVSAYDAATTQGGTVLMSSNGHFTYTPPSAFTGDDTFTYTASQGVPSSVATVTIHVTHIPVVDGATLSRQQGSPASSSSIASVSDAETPPGSLVVTTGSSAGIALSGVANTAGAVTGTVGAACTATTGAHTVAVHATDTDGFTGDGVLTVNVTANTGPVLTYGSLAANSGTGTTGDPLTGPSDNGSVSSLAIQSVTPAFTGTITVDGPASGTPGRLHVTNAGPSGTYTVTVRATDNCAQTTDVPVTLAVNAAPTVNAGGDDTTSLLSGPYTLSGSASDDGLAPGTGLVTTWSQISGPGTTTFDDSHSLTAAATFDVGGVYVLQLAATDGQLTSTDTVQITVNSQPSITVPSDITVGEFPPGAGADVAFTVTATGYPAPTVTCLDGTTAVTSGDHFAAGVHTIACQAENVAGIAGGSFTITVNSTPVVTVPSDITVDESSPGAGYAVSFSVTATGVPAPLIACVDGTTSVSSGDLFAVGSHTISCTATNSSGTDTKSFQIIVRSVPVITVPADFSAGESPAGSGQATVPFTVTATGYPTPTITCLEGSTAVASGDTFTAGSHTIDCTATNGAGSDTASFTLTVDSGPVITVPSDITVDESSPGAGRAVSFSVTATGVPAASIACVDGSASVTSGDLFAVGSHTISCTATNSSGTDTKSFQIMVRSVPVITVPADFSAGESPAGSGHAAVPFTVTATGYPTPTITCLEGSTVVASGDTFTAGSHTIDCTATNGAGSDTASFTLTVDSGPVITVPSDITVDESSPGAGRAVSFSVTATGVPAASIACVDGSASVTSGDLFAVGSHTISCTATNSSGTDTKSFQIIVRSVPVITVPADFSVVESPAGSGHAAVPFTVTATGFPTPVITCLEGSTAVASGDTFTAGAHTVDCTATNGAGSDTASFTLTVDTVPVVTVPSDITVNESSPGAGRAVSFSVTATGLPTPSIACLEGSTAVASGDTFDVGSHTISCTATSSSGTDTGTFHIIVRSVPVITVPADFSVVESPAGSGHAAVPFTVTATGFPTPVITCLEGSTAVASGDTFSTGSHTVDCTATNGAGTDTGSFVLTVKSGPVVTVPSAITVTEASAGSGAAVPFTVTATGVPSPAVVCLDGSTTVHSGDAFAAGVHTVSCTATNSVGTDTKSFTITVRSLPVLTVPASFTAVESPVGSGTASVPFTVTATGTPAPVIVCKIGSTTVASPVTLAIGAHQIDCVATNAVGPDSKSFTVTVAPGNHAPVAHAGGPYSVVEGQSLTLSAASSTDADGDALSYSWDVNGDGVFGDAVGVAPTLTWAELSALGIADGPATFAAKVRVDDSKAAPVTSAAATVTVVNAAPAGSIAGEARWASGRTVSLTFAGTDPSAADQAAGFGYFITWGDGSSSGPVHAGSSLAKTHTYPAVGGYTVTLTVTDKDGAVSAVVSKTLTVSTVIADVCGSGKTLLIGGTPGDDVITIKAGSTSNTIDVVVNGVTEPVAVGFTRVVVNAGAGNDKVTFTGGPSVKRILYGGSGNDTLVSGNGPAVLVGGDGKDLLTGGSKRDVLIGGAGADVEHGAAGDDILIDGATAFDAFTTTSEKALCGIQAEWLRTGVSFAGRVAHLLGQGHGSLSSTHFILSGPHRNVFSGGDKDQLDGGSGLNWYLCNIKGKGVRDVLLHRTVHDRVTDL